MTLPASLLIGLRYSKSRKANQFIAFINMFSIAGIALGLMALIITTSVMNGFESQLKQRILGLTPHFVVDTEQLPKSLNLSEFINKSSAFVEAEAVLQSANGLKPLYLQGIDANDDAHALISQNMRVGELSSLQPKGYNIVIGRALAVNLDVTLGDKVRVILAGTSVYTPMGRMPAQRKFTVVGIYDLASELDDKVALVNINDLARLQRKKTNEIRQTRLFLNDPFQFPQVRASLEQAKLEYYDWRERQGALFDAVKMEKNMMVVMLLLIIAVAAFNIVSALVMVVNEKQGDIAILRTQGMAQRNIMFVFMINGLLNGVKGAVIGVALGLLVTSQINPVMKFLNLPIVQFLPDGSLPIVIDAWQISSIVMLTLLLSFIASLYPAWRALKIEPANALRYE
ncbi:MAG: lipoprotein-releasing ABC transporter permease subunit [Alteromonadaceae bacterium]|nr:lipoprotein-releasing ABC transporter permease subunit [Alteromonadaceae bacterium]